MEFANTSIGFFTGLAWLLALSGWGLFIWSRFNKGDYAENEAKWQAWVAGAVEDIEAKAEQAKGDVADALQDVLIKLKS